MTKQCNENLLKVKRKIGNFTNKSLNLRLSPQHMYKLDIQHILVCSLLFVFHSLLAESRSTCQHSSRLFLLLHCSDIFSLALTGIIGAAVSSYDALLQRLLFLSKKMRSFMMATDSKYDNSLDRCGKSYTNSQYLNQKNNSVTQMSRGCSMCPQGIVQQ